MMKMIAIALLAGTAVAASVPADASQGCGRDGHRGYHGHCRPDRRFYRHEPALVIGTYYHGRGYWDGHRYWHNRYRYHGGWRYR